MPNPKGNPHKLVHWRSTWRSGSTKTIRVYVALAEQIQRIARAIDEGKQVKIVDTVSENNHKILEAVKIYRRGEVMQTYSVVVVGARRSGKTVFLASLFNQLGIPNPKLGFYLDVEGKQGKKLNQVYKQLVTGDTWPPGTRANEISEWIFTVQTKNVSVHSACRFKYLDYAGGLVTDPELVSDLEEKCQQAHAVLGFLDGQKILAFMNRFQASDESWMSQKADEFQYEDLPNMLQLMLKVPEEEDNRKPIHFLLTKWDLLEDHFTLEEIREQLLKERQFRNFVETRINEGCTIRLIPVSAVGSGFAQLLPNGEMQKVRRVDPEPFQLEMPLACILPDKIETELNQLQNKGFAQQKALQDALSEELEIPTEEQFKEFAGGSLRVLSQILPFGRKQVQRWGSSLEENAREKRIQYDQRQQELQNELYDSRKKVNDTTSAFRYVLGRFEYLEGELERKFSASRITDEDL